MPLYFPRRQFAVHTIAVALVVGIGVLVFAQTRSYGLLGMDSYPIILTSRVASLADFWGNFTERLMDGLYPGKFYRPLLNFTFAADYALWGLEPAGYQLSNVVWFGVSGLALYLFLASLPGSRSPWPALAGLLFFLLHPLHFEAIPYPPRRPEFLCLAFVLLALSAESRRGKAYRLFGALATLLALASKETALILPALVFAQRWIYSTGSGRGRWFTAIRAAAVSAAVVAIYVATRLAVLGGMGGHRKSLSVSTFEGVPESIGTLFRTASSPQLPSSWAALGAWGALAILLMIAMVLSRSSSGGEAPRLWPAMPSDLLFGASWIVLLAVMVTASGRLSPWYFVMVVAGFSILVAGVVEGGVQLIRRGSWVPRLCGVLSLAAVALITAHWQGRWSPLVRNYDVWRVATVEYAELVKEVGSRIEGAEDGAVIGIRIPRRQALLDHDAAMYRGVVRLGHYSIQAWARLQMPDRNVRVLKHRQHLQAKPAKSTEVVVVLDREPKAPKRNGRQGKR